MAATTEGQGTSYKINSVHYEGTTSFRDMRLLRPSEISSMRQQYKYGTFSYGQSQEPFYNLDDGSVVFKTPNNIFRTPLSDAEKYGSFFNNDDFGMKGWLAAGEDVKPIMFDEVPVLPELIRHVAQEHLHLGIDIPEGMWEGVPLRMHFPDKRDTPVMLYTRATLANIPMNKAGYYISKIANSEQYLRNMLFDFREKHRGEFNPELLAWLQHLGEHSYRNPGELIGIGVEKARFYAATLTGKYPYLLFPEDFEQKMEKQMERWGLHGPVEKQMLVDSILFHELYHFFPKGVKSIFGNWYIEHRAGELQGDFYDKRLKIAVEEDAGIYRILAGIEKNYASSWSFWNTVLHELKKTRAGHKDSLESMLRERFEAEAVSLGLKESEIESYVSGKMAEYGAREALTKALDGGVNSEKGGLEEKVEGSSEKSDSKARKSAGVKEKGKMGYMGILAKMRVYERDEIEKDQEPDSDEDGKSNTPNEGEADEGEGSQGEPGSSSE